MKRQNSRNASSNRGTDAAPKEEKKLFNHTSSNPSARAGPAKKSKLSNGNSRQSPFVSDLYKSNTQQRDEIFQMFGEVDVPDDTSLTISSMSQSPFQARLNLSNTHGTHEQSNSNDNEGTLGRSELEGTYSNDINKTGTNKSLSMTRRNDQFQHTSQSYMEEEEDNELDRSSNQDDSDNDDYNSAYKHPRVNRRQPDNQNLQDQSLLDHSEITHNNNGRDSPDFNRQNNTTYDLTVSQTVISNQNNTQRGISANQNTKRGSTNRTLADSVLNLQSNQFTSSSNNNTHRGAHPRRLNRVGDEAALISTDENLQEESEEDKEFEERDEEEEVDASDLSAVDSFTQTMQSRSYSRMGHSRFTQRGAPEDMSMKRSPVAMQRGSSNNDHDESYSLTPQTNDGKWHLNQKSYLHTSTTANNRTAGSDNPLNRITTNIGQVLKTNRTAQYEGRQDQELFEALENTQQVQLRRGGGSTLQDSENSQMSADNRSSNRKVAQLQMKVSQLNIYCEQLKSQHSMLANTCEIKDKELYDMGKQIVELQTINEDKEDHILLLKQKFKDNEGLPKLRSKILDQAKLQNKQLCHAIEEREYKIRALDEELERNNNDNKALVQAHINEINRLITDGQKSDILLKGKDRELLQLKQEIQALRQNQESELTELEAKYKNQATRLEHNYSMKVQELQQHLDKAVKQLKTKDKDLTNRISENQDLESLVTQKDKALNAVEKENSKLNNELKAMKERCKSFEQELEQIRGFENSSMFGNNSVSYTAGQSTQAKRSDYDVKQMKDVFDKKLGKLQEEFSKKTQQCKELETDLLRVREEKRHLEIKGQTEELERQEELIRDLSKMKSELDDYRGFEQDIRFCLTAENSCSREQLQAKLSEICKEIETMHLLKHEFEKVTGKYREAQKEILELKQAAVKQSSINPSNQISVFQINQLKEKLRECQELRAKLDEETEKSQKFEHLNISLEAQNRTSQSQNINLTAQLENINLDFLRLKDESAQNLDKLKEKLRSMMKENSELKASIAIPTQQPENEYKAKYLELFQLIMSVELASDPLNVELQLQQSFFDELEQARKHLESQVKLVTALLDQHNKDKQQLLVKNTQIEHNLNKTQADFDALLKTQQKTQEQLRDSNRQLERLDAENGQMTNQCEALTRQLRDFELELSRKREETEEAQKDLRKVLRTQEHLHKSQITKPVTVQQPQKQNQQELERIIMHYEDQLSKAYRQLTRTQQIQQQIFAPKPSLSNLELHSLKETAKYEIFETLDKLLDSKTANLPVLNDLTQQLQMRIEKLRTQERLKLSAEQPPIIVMQQLDMEEEVNSPSKWPKAQPLKNYFTQEDNNSLLFSDLQVKPPQACQKCLDFKERVAQLEAQVENQQEDYEQNEVIAELEAQMEEANQQIQGLQEEQQELMTTLTIKSQALTEQESLIDRLTKDLQLATENQLKTSNQHKSRETQLWSEVDALKTRIRDELITKSQKLEEEYEELSKLKDTQRMENQKLREELEAKLQLKAREQEREFLTKLSLIEKEKEEGGKNVLKVYKDLEQDWNRKLSIAQDDFTKEKDTLTKDLNSKLEDIKKTKDRELKRLKEDHERVKKSLEDKLKKLETDFTLERDTWERDLKTQLETQNIKAKKELEKARDKVRADSRNQLDMVKNEMARAKADFEREKKKLQSDNERNQEQIKRELESQHETELRAALVKAEDKQKKWRDQEHQRQREKAEAYELQMTQMAELQREELRRERERVELMVGHKVRQEVKAEVLEEIEREYGEQIASMAEQQRYQIEAVKLRSEEVIRELKLQVTELQLAQNVPQRDFGVQANLSQDLPLQVQMQQQEDSQVVIGNQSYCSQGNGANSYYVEQMRSNFEEELERQQQIFEVQLTAKQVNSVRIFEEVMTLEFDKILQSIYAKSTNTQDSRKHINTLILDILARNDDRKDHQMQSSMETLKRKIAEILRVFKSELEKKLSKRTAKQMEDHRKEWQKELSEVVSQQRFLQEVEQMTSQYTGSEDGTSAVATPRGQDTQDTNDEDKENRNNQFSDIKRYLSEEVDENNCNQILKKVAPVPNAKGVLVVEVDKVLRDMRLLLSTLKQSKFYMLLTPVEEQLVLLELQKQEQDSDQTLAAYRALLNDFLKVMVKLNSGAENLGKQTEVYKLKLLNSELQKQVRQLKEADKSLLLNTHVDDIVNYYETRKNYLTTETLKCLRFLESTQMTLNKQQFKLLSLIECFTLNDELNRNLAEVNHQCQNYLQQNPIEEQTLLMSHGMGSPDKPKLTPEMLSPEETAQLIAQVFQKLNQTQQINNQQFDTHQSFFQTFLSNEDYVKSAETFIQKYRENLNFTQKYQKNLPLQMTRDNPYNRTANARQHYHSVQLNQLNKKRCRSASNNSNSSQLPLQPQNMQSYVTNVFQSNLMDQKSSCWSQNQRQDTMSQQAPITMFQRNQSVSTLGGKANQPYQSLMNKNTQLSIDEVASTQSNVNRLFERLRHNFSSASRDQSFHQQ